MFRTFRHLAAALIIFAMVHGYPAQADVYEWTDKNGIRHYSNIMPPPRGDITRSEENIQNLLPGTPFKVLKVFDGDTIRAKGSGLTLKVRLVGIDAPEKGRKGLPGQPFANMAKQALEKLLGGRQIRLKQYGTGGYNRVLAEIFTGSRNINLEMLEKGLAEVYRGKPAEGLNTGAYKSAEKKARARRTGIWSQGKNYKSPRQWRKENPWK